MDVKFRMSSWEIYRRRLRHWWKSLISILNIEIFCREMLKTKRKVIVIFSPPHHHQYSQLLPPPLMYRLFIPPRLIIEWDNEIPRHVDGSTLHSLHCWEMDWKEVKSRREGRRGGDCTCWADLDITSQMNQTVIRGKGRARRVVGLTWSLLLGSIK